MSFIDFMLVKRHAFAKTFTNVSLIDDIPNTPKIEMGSGNLVPILDISSKQIHEIFLGKYQIPLAVKGKLTDK